jgi:hypothetical protein
VDVLYGPVGLVEKVLDPQGDGLEVGLQALELLRGKGPQQPVALEATCFVRRFYRLVLLSSLGSYLRLCPNPLAGQPSDRRAKKEPR